MSLNVGDLDKTGKELNSQNNSLKSDSKRNRVSQWAVLKSNVLHFAEKVIDQTPKSQCREN